VAPTETVAYTIRLHPTSAGGIDDWEVLARYKRAIFDLISEAKRIRTVAEDGGEIGESDKAQLGNLKATVKLALFSFGKSVEQIVYSGCWV